MAEPVFFEFADKLCKWSVCSKCWSDLVKREDPESGGWIVECSNDPRHAGTVSRKTAEQRQAQDYSEYREVRRLLIRLGLIENPLAGKSADDLRKDLGY